MLGIQVINDPAAATVALEPMRTRLLSELAAPASAATLAWALGSSPRWATSFVVRERRANVWRPWRWIPTFASGRRQTGRLSPNELTEAIAQLVAKYHDAPAAGGRAHRLVVVAHPPAAEIQA
jgi:hypothetical protein